MELTRRDEHEVTILTVEGEVDLSDLPKLRAHLDALVESGRSRVVFNLSQLALTNSTAIGFLISARNRCEMALSEPSEFFERTLDTLGLENAFEVFSTDEEAVRHLRGV